MSMHNGLPVSGYRPQTATAVETVNIHKDMEERLLRHMDLLKADADVDQRWLAISRTGIEQAFMAMNRAVFKPARVTLPDDREQTP